MIVLGGAFGAFSGSLSVQADSLWQLRRSGQLTLLFVRWPGYYPPEWSICLPVDTVLPWLQVDQGKGTKRKE